MEQIFEIDGEAVGKLGINPDNDQVALMNKDNTNAVMPDGFVVTNNQGQKRQIDFSWVGLKLNEDLSEELPNEKLLFAQRAYCEKPTTLISVLSNCNAEQLTEVRNLLSPPSESNNTLTDIQKATILHAQSLLVSKGLHELADLLK